MSDSSSPAETRRSREASRSFREWVRLDPRRARADSARLYRSMRDSTAVFGGEIIDFLYEPLFMDSRDGDFFRDICGRVDGINRKITEEYLKNPDFRGLWGFPVLLEELIRADPGYANPAPMTRVDIFHSPDHRGVRLCEINTDGTSGMNEITELETRFEKTEAYSALARDFAPRRFALIEPWVDTVMNLGRDYWGRPPGRIVITDWEGCGVREEFKAFKHAFARRGPDVRIADPREFVYRDGRLRIDGEPVDIVYRRAVTRECFERAGEIGDLLHAYRDGAVCVIGGFRSQLLHSKRFFVLASGGFFDGFLDPGERDFLRTRVPRTTRLGGPGGGIGGGPPVESPLIEKALDDRSGFIIKPEDSYAAEGVTAGRDHNGREWREALNRAAEAGGYILQEYVDLGVEPYLDCTPDGFEEIPCRNVLGLYSYEGNFAGVYTRAGDSSIIASRWKSRVAPTFLV